MLEPSCSTPATLHVHCLIRAFVHLAQSFNDPPPASIDRRKLQANPVSHQHADEVAVRPVGDMRRHAQALRQAWEALSRGAAPGGSTEGTPIQSRPS